jgi:putative transposase
VTVYRFISAQKASYPVTAMCRALTTSRSAFYAWEAADEGARATGDRCLLVRIQAAHAESRGTYGSPRVLAALRRDGVAIGRRRVARLMRANGLAGVPCRRFRKTTDSEHSLPIAPNIVDRDFSADEPNQVWVADITYVSTAAGWLYVAVLVDLFSRKVVGWAAANHMRTELCLEALESAIALRGPPAGLVHHSDRGSQYASRAYRDRLTAIGAVCSMSSKGDCWDNAVAESFFGTLKTELVHRKSWSSPAEARLGVAEYVHQFYNPVRLHSSIGYKSPIEAEIQYARGEAIAA